MKNIDYPIAVLVGFLAGSFAIPTLVNLGLRNKPLLVVLPLVAAILFLAGIAIGVWLTRWVAVFRQLARFAAVGFLNTAIDFGILNLLSFVTGITAGLVVGGINVPGFAVAVTNSYLWNKFWVFGASRQSTLFRDFPKFLGISIVGLLLNSAIVTFVATYLPSPLPVAQTLWLNLAKVAATLVALAWNFLGYKFLVFK